MQRFAKGSSTPMSPPDSLQRASPGPKGMGRRKGKRNKQEEEEEEEEEEEKEEEE